jgi:hypothetical protein
MAATLILLPVYAVGNKIWDASGAYTGMNDNIINYFYVHNLFNAWFTTGGIGLALYLLPRLTNKPLYSHGLAMWGLWSVWTGQHHQLWSPAPDWLELLTVVFSILAMIPTLAFTWNFLKTMEGRWFRVGQDVALRFFVVGAIFWGFTCHMAVNHIAGAMSLGKIKSQDKLIGFGRQFFDGFQGSSRHGLLGPFKKGAHSLTKVVSITGVIDVPNLLLNIIEDRLPAFLAAVADFEEGM